MEAELTKTLFVENAQPMISSLVVAERFGRRHSDVLRDIKALNTSASFIERNFALNQYTDNINRKLPCYNMTQSGFIMLVMGFRSKEAFAVKERYIEAFEMMREKIQAEAVALAAADLMERKALEQEGYDLLLVSGALELNEDYLFSVEQAAERCSLTVTGLMNALMYKQWVCKGSKSKKWRCVASAKKAGFVADVEYVMPRSNKIDNKVMFTRAGYDLLLKIFPPKQFSLK